MTKDEALKLALEFLEQGIFVYPTSLATAIKEALAQPDVDRRSTESKETFDQQEPVAITITGKLGNIYSFTGDYSLKKGDKVYTTPPQRKPLTDDEIHAIYDEVARREPYNMAVTRRNIARAIEAAHGIKE